MSHDDVSVAEIKTCPRYKTSHFIKLVVEMKEFTPDICNRTDLTIPFHILACRHLELWFIYSPMMNSGHITREIFHVLCEPPVSDKDLFKRSFFDMYEVFDASMRVPSIMFASTLKAIITNVIDLDTCTRKMLSEKDRFKKVPPVLCDQAKLTVLTIDFIEDMFEWLLDTHAIFFLRVCSVIYPAIDFFVEVFYEIGGIVDLAVKVTEPYQHVLICSGMYLAYRFFVRLLKL